MGSLAIGEPEPRSRFILILLVIMSNKVNKVKTKKVRLPLSPPFPIKPFKHNNGDLVDYLPSPVTP